MFLPDSKLLKGRYVLCINSRTRRSITIATIRHGVNIGTYPASCRRRHTIHLRTRAATNISIANPSYYIIYALFVGTWGRKSRIISRCQSIRHCIIMNTKVIAVDNHFNRTISVVSDGCNLCMSLVRKCAHQYEQNE